MREHLDAAGRQRLTGTAAQEATGNFTCGQALKEYQERLKTGDIRPNTKAFREAGIKLVPRSGPAGRGCGRHSSFENSSFSESRSCRCVND